MTIVRILYNPKQAFQRCDDKIFKCLFFHFLFQKNLDLC